MRSYEAARSLFSFLGFCSWCVICVGGLVAILGASAASEMSSFYGGRASGGAILSGLVPGLAVSFLGFLGLATVQNGRATVDTAEYSQQMLKIARDQLEVSKQGNRDLASLPKSFSDFEQNAAREPVPAATSIETEPTMQSEETAPPATIEYRGRSIRIEGGFFVYGSIPFQNEEKAKSYIDALELTAPNRSLRLDPADRV